MGRLSGGMVLPLPFNSVVLACRHVVHLCYGCTTWATAAHHRPPGTSLEAINGLQHCCWHNMLMPQNHGSWCLGTLGNWGGRAGW